jgi:hypothetical protein
MRRIIAALAGLALLAGVSACGKPDASETEPMGHERADEAPSKPVEIDPATGQPVVKETSADPAAKVDSDVIGSVTPSQSEARPGAYRSQAPQIDSNVADLTTPTTDQPK